jgi:glycosyltransferase domain-containing protein
MATLFIPTRNRPYSLDFVLKYFSETAPGTPIVIADGSETSMAKKNISVAEKYNGKLKITLRQYDEKTPYTHRFIDALQSVDDEYVVMGADDDYLDMDVIRKGEDHLRDNPDYVLALGYRVDMDERKKTTSGQRFSIPSALKWMTRWNGYSTSRNGHLPRHTAYHERNICSGATKTSLTWTSKSTTPKPPCP